MIARLKQKESPGRALRRACQEHAAKALAHLKSKNLPEAIHEVRKEIKRMRALFRLTRGLLGGKEYRKLARVMRLAPRPLAAARDARVTRKAFESLVNSNARRFPRLRSALQTYCHTADRDLKNVGAGAVAELILERVREQLENLRLHAAGWTEMRRGLERSYARGRAAYQQVLRQPTPENLHQWRQCVKNLWYQLDFLCPAWPPKTRTLVAGLDKLGVALGADHDLVLLDRFGREHCAPDSEVTRVQELITAGRPRRLAAVCRLGARLFGNDPAAVLAQVETDWKAWRKA